MSHRPLDPIVNFQPYTPQRTLAIRAAREARWALLNAPPPPKAPRATAVRKPKELIIPPALMALPEALRNQLIAELRKSQ